MARSLGSGSESSAVRSSFCGFLSSLYFSGFFVGFFVGFSAGARAGDSSLPGPGWNADSDQSDAWFGSAVAGAGDVDGDGFFDVIVGAHRFDNGENAEGRVFVYHGSPTGPDPAPSWMTEVNHANAWFGYSVASAGDANGDGYSDVLVGAPRDGEGMGRVYLYLGSATGLGPIPAAVVGGDQLQAWFGWSVASAGDVDADGFSDAVVGAVFFDSAHLDDGAVFGYRGSASGIATAPAWMAAGDQAFGEFGNSLAGAGDVNGDGFSDVVIGAPEYHAGQIAEGRAFVHLGSSSGLASVFAWSAEGNHESAKFAWSVAGAGDVNGDGFSDVVIGAPFFEDAQADGGRAFLYTGADGGLAGTPAWTDGKHDYGQFGSAVTGAGDANGDGYSDVVIGAPLFDSGEVDSGAAFRYAGAPVGPPLAAAGVAGGAQTGAEFGHSLASAGDVDGDARSDFIVGARFFDDGQSDEGEAFVYLGMAAASASSYGVGKPGTTGIPNLASPAPPVLGGAVTLEISGGLPGAGPVILFAGAAPASLPFDGGTLLVLPSFVAVLAPLGSDGTTSVTGTLPPRSHFAGTHLYFQAGIVDPGAAGPLHLALTNGLDGSLGQ